MRDLLKKERVTPNVKPGQGENVGTLSRSEDEDTRGLLSLLDPPARLRTTIAKISPALESKVIERIQVLLDREGSYLVDAHILLAVSLYEILHERFRGLEDEIAEDWSCNADDRAA